VGFVVDKVALEQVYFEYFRLPCQSFHRLLRIHHHHHHLSFGAGTMSQTVAVTEWNKKGTIYEHRPREQRSDIEQNYKLAAPATLEHVSFCSSN
jgi:hypothetical protein